MKKENQLIPKNLEGERGITSYAMHGFEGVRKKSNQKLIQSGSQSYNRNLVLKKTILVLNYLTAVHYFD